MSLHLDARQRAMLQEMGVRVWQAPEARHALHAPAAQAANSGAQAATAVPAQVQRGGATPAVPGPRAALRAGVAAPTPARAETDTEAGAVLRLLPPRLLYPDANPAHTPAALGAGWLIIAPEVAPGEPKAEDAVRLLHAMLQALQLHRHPRVVLCALQAQTTAASAGDAAPTDMRTDIAAQVAAFAPSVVLLMGRNAIRAALGSGEPLAKLRVQDLRIGGVPVVATYDAPLLLRNPQGKRAAWADLCRARALARPPAP